MNKKSKEEDRSIFHRDLPWIKIEKSLWKFVDEVEGREETCPFGGEGASPSEII